MNAEFRAERIWLALTLLGLAYALSGWYLSGYHIFWLMGIFAIAITLAGIEERTTTPILGFFEWIITRQLLIVLAVALLISLVIILILTNPILLSLIFLPLVTLLYTQLEMRADGFNQADIFWYSVIVAGLGLGIGEAVDLFFIPSMRY